MPRTMCLTSASGCSFVGAPGLEGASRRPQSVLDLLEVEVGFTLRGFAQGDDADFIFGLRVNNRNWHASQKAKRLEPLLTIAEAIIFKGVGHAFEDARGVDEVKAVFLEVDRALALGPSELHVASVATNGSYDKSCRFLGLTPELSRAAKQEVAPGCGG